MVELYLLLIAMLGAAVVAIEIRDLLAAAVAMGIVGFSVAIMFILVQAPDLAIVQIVIEILTVIFFAAIIIRTTHIDSTVGVKPQYLPTIVYFVFGTLFLIIAIYAIRDIPRFGEPLMRVARVYINDGLAKTGAANIVAAVILDYRAYDTLGEAVVLFTSVLGVLTIIRSLGRKE